MGAEAEAETETEKRSILELPIFSLASIRATERPGTVASPLHTAASVPFRWEEQPGKPRVCTPTSRGAVKCLDLPPRLLYVEAKLRNKTPSPTTVLDGPDHHHHVGGRSIFQSYSSSRFIRGKTHESSSPFEGGSGGSSPERGLLGGPLVLSSRRVTCRDGGLFGSLRRRAFSFRTKREVTDGGSFVFLDREVDGHDCGGDSGGGCTEVEPPETVPAVKVTSVTSVTSVKRKRSPFFGLSGGARANFWATIYGALKQVIPRRSNKDDS